VRGTVLAKGLNVKLGNVMDSNGGCLSGGRRGIEDARVCPGRKGQKKKTLEGGGGGRGPLRGPGLKKGLESVSEKLL